jgi:hypothetical protein
MEWINSHLWTLFFICLGVVLLSFMIMNRLGKRFVTMAPDNKKFSVFRLEFPGSDAQLSKLVLQMSGETKSAVRAHLFVDYFFMLGAYPAIAILCYKTALVLDNSHPAASIFLLIMASIQVIAFAFDATENIMLLRKLANISSWNEESHERYSKIVFYKFMIALFALATVGCSWIYMWLIHLIPWRFVKGVSIAAAIAILYVIGMALYARIKRRAKERRELLIARQMLNV